MAQNRKETLKYSPPQSVDAEQAVLGSILRDKEAFAEIAAYFNDTSVFYFPKHQLIFYAILSLYERGEPFDITTVAEELTKLNNLEKTGGRLYLIDLIDGVASTANIASYADIVLEKAALRKLINTSSNITQTCYDQDTEATEILNDAEKKIFQLRQINRKKGFVRLGSILPETFDEIDGYMQKGSEVTGLASGLTKLDEITCGFHDSEFIVIAGRPSMGKTSLAMNIAENVALNEKKPVAIFSLEMAQNQLSLRMLCGKARVNSQLVRKGNIQDDEWNRLIAASGILDSAPIYVDDTPDLSDMEFRAKARRIKSQKDVGLIILDYLGLMKSRKRYDNRQQEVAMFCQAIKGMARELEIPIIVLVQLSRQVETRGKNKRPQLSDLRESGAIEQDADVVMFVYRPEVYLEHLPPTDKKRLDAKGKAEIIVAKQRSGPTGSAHLAFVKQFVRFENLAYNQVEEESYDQKDTLF